MRSTGIGVSVVTRVAQILHAVADYEPAGARLVDIAEATGIARSTVHRILGELGVAGLIEQRGGRRYGLGTAVSELGLVAPVPFTSIARIQTIVERLAERSTVTAYVGALVHRRVYYLARGQGSSPVHVHVIGVGDSTPLPATHAGIALLSTMPTRVQDQILAEAQQERTRSYRSVPLVLDDSAIRRAMHDVETHGFFRMHDLAIEGVSGMAALVPATAGRPRMAVTLAAVGDQLLGEQSAQQVSMLVEAAAEIGEVVHPLRREKL
jgi:DNA-binding IclR family transcriptional regulator